MNQVAMALLNSKSIYIEPDESNYFTWTSGKKSPIYCNNRQLISYPEYRQIITKLFCELIKKKSPNVDVIAGTATAGIPWAAWIAQELELPMIYIRSAAKGHGLQTAIEGKFQKKQNVVIVEDLISTGKSSMNAYRHCNNEELKVNSIISIFTYQFTESIKLFKDNNILTYSLCTLADLLQHAKINSELNDSQIEGILDWKNKA